MKIAILYICTGKYDIFWKDFYISAERYFLPNCKKEYFVFTDSENIYDSSKENVHIIYQENLNWPGNTLFRFRMFSRIIDELEKFDYIFFLNANAVFLKEVNEDILPEKEGLLVVRHPGYYDKPRESFPYDTNPKSLACINSDEGQVYVCGGFNGGKSNEYIKMIKELEKNIDTDYNNGVIALWHDESQINRYIIGKEYKLLGPEYMYPEDKDAPFDIIVILRDKNKYGGHDFIRGNKVSIIKKIKNKVKKIIKG